MANFILPPLDILDRAAADLVAVTEDAARQRAIDKAIYEYHQGLQVVISAGAFLVPSFREAGVVYRVNSAGQCSCKAGQAAKPCKHAAAIDLLTEAGKYTMPALDRKAASRKAYEEACALMDELYS
jgi:hypothetical protein